MEAVKVCTKLCNDCPFSNTSMKGFLAEYSFSDIKVFMQTDTLFPCHKVLPNEFSKTPAETSEHVKQGDFALCRGYAESMIKSCVSPKNKDLKNLLEKVREEGISEHSMSMCDFEKHHTPKILGVVNV